MDVDITGIMTGPGVEAGTKLQVEDGGEEMVWQQPWVL